jgi:RNA recognition motif-containing protein
VEFVSQEEAKNAFKNLQDSHLYGRKVIIEWAKADDSAFTNIEGSTNTKKQKI